MSGVTGAIFRGYDTEEEAVECYAEALRLGRVRVVPDINNILGRVSSFITPSLNIYTNYLSIRTKHSFCFVFCNNVD